MTLTDIRTELQEKKPGKWHHNKIFEDVEVAFDNHLRPSVFWLAEENDKAFMVARKRAKGTMEAWEHHLNEIELVKNAPKGKGKGKKG